MKTILGTFSLLAAVFARPGISGYEYPGPNISPIIDIGSSNPPLSMYLPSQPSQTYIPGDTGVPSPTYLPTGGIQDQRHVYFFAAPEVEQQSRLRIYLNPTGQRNTKIIFVKAPSYGAVIPEVIAPSSQSEDKTKIFVLVRKQDQNGAITIPASAGVKQAKPEVFFIKYSNKYDAKASVEQGLRGNVAGHRLDDLGNQQSFISTISSSRVVDHGSDQFLPGISGQIGNIGDGVNAGYRY